MRHLIPILVFVLIVTLAPAASAAGGLQQDFAPLPGSLWKPRPGIETGPEAVQPGSGAAANIVPGAYGLPVPSRQQLGDLRCQPGWIQVGAVDESPGPGQRCG